MTGRMRTDPYFGAVLAVCQSFRGQGYPQADIYPMLLAEYLGRDEERATALSAHRHEIIPFLTQLGFRVHCYGDSPDRNLDMKVYLKPGVYEKYNTAAGMEDHESVNKRNGWTWHPPGEGDEIWGFPYRGY